MKSIPHIIQHAALGLVIIHTASIKNAFAQPEKSYSAVHERGNVCAFGLLNWCLAEQEAAPTPENSIPLEVDMFGTYKFLSNYYIEEVDACESVGCKLNQQGWSYGGAINYRFQGNGRDW